MSGISSASGTLAARHCLHDAFTVALTGDQDVDIYFGYQWPIVHTAWAALTHLSSDTDFANIGPRRALDETITFHASIGAWEPGHDEASMTAAFDRAFGILDTIQTHIRDNDITLGDTVLWCVPGPTASDGVEDEDGSGYTVEIDASFVCAHRTRAT